MALRLEVRVRRIDREAEGINSYELVAADGADLPPFAAGAHIDMHLPGRTHSTVLAVQPIVGQTRGDLLDDRSHCPSEFGVDMSAFPLVCIKVHLASLQSFLFPRQALPLDLA